MLVDNAVLKKQISDAVISFDAVQTYWKAITEVFPRSSNSIVYFLQAVKELWVSVCGHSFAQRWFETKCKRGTSTCKHYKHTHREK